MNLLLKDDSFLNWLFADESSSTTTQSPPTTQSATTTTTVATTPSRPQPEEVESETVYSRFTVPQLCNAARVLFPEPSTRSLEEMSDRELVVNIIYYICMPVSQSSRFGLNAAPFGVLPDVGDVDSPTTTSKPEPTTMSSRWKILLDALSSVKETDNEDGDKIPGEETEPSPDDTEQELQDALGTGEDATTTPPPPNGDLDLTESEEDPESTYRHILEILSRNSGSWNSRPIADEGVWIA